MDILQRATEEYFRRIVATVSELARHGQGVEDLGPVPGRPGSEDRELGIDRVCLDRFEEIFQKTGLRMDVYSEHGIRQIGSIGDELIYLVGCDPFDGSGLFLRGLPAAWWSVLTIYGSDDLVPLGGGAVDLLRKEIYLIRNSQVTLLSLEDERRIEIFPSRKTSIDDSTVIAAYMIDPSYLLDWTLKTGLFLNNLVHKYPRARLWPNGGSCIYAWLARGLVHAYLMFDEPRSEIDPGLGLAWASGYQVFEVQPNGTLEQYRFIPSRYQERVPILLAACTRELAENIVSEMM